VLIPTISVLQFVRLRNSFYTSLCRTNTAIIKPCCVRNMSETYVCIFKNLSRVHGVGEEYLALKWLKAKATNF